MQVKLRKGTYNGEQIMFNCAEFDFSSAVVDVDYHYLDIEEKILPTTGESVHLLGFSIPLAGIDKLSGYDDDPDSEQNLCKNWEIDIREENGVWVADTAPDAVSLTIGEQPGDWETGWRYKYYTRVSRTDITGFNGIAYHYTPASQTFNSATQYYQIDGRQEVYYTDGLGFFGLSNFAAVGKFFVGTEWQLGEIQSALARAFTGFFGDNDPEQRPFYWRAGGATGNTISTSSWIPKRFSSYFATTSSTAQTISGKNLMQLCHCKYQDEDYVGIVLIKVSTDGIPQEATFTGLSYSYWKAESTPANSGPYSHSQGGRGSFDAPSESRGDRYGNTVWAKTNNWNTFSSGSFSTYNRYRIDPNTILGKEVIWDTTRRLWSPSIFESYKNQFVNPRDSIITCHLMPALLAPPANSSTGEVVAAGEQLSDELCPLFTSPYTSYHVGDVDVSTYFDGFPDFDNTSIYIHLPYVGTRQLDIEAAMDGIIGVDYVSDVRSGAVTAWIWVQDRYGNANYRYEFAGNCSMDFPLAYRQATIGGAIGQSIISTAGAAIVGGVIGGVGGAIGNSAAYVANAGTTKGLFSFGMEGIGGEMLKGATSGAGAQLGSGISNLYTNSANAANAGTGLLSSNAHGGSVTAPIDTQCYLTIVRPQWSNPEEYDTMFGYPSDIEGVVGRDFEGFLACRSAKLNGLTATDVERAEIGQLLASGVYVS